MTTLTESIKQTDASLSAQELYQKYTVKDLKEILPQVGVTELMAQGKEYWSETKLRPLSYSDKTKLITAYREALQDLKTPPVDRPTSRVRRRWTVELEGKGCNGQKEIVKIERGDKDSIKFINEVNGYEFSTTIDDLKALIALTEEDQA